MINFRDRFVVETMLYKRLDAYWIVHIDHRPPSGPREQWAPEVYFNKGFFVYSLYDMSQCCIHGDMIIWEGFPLYRPILK